MPSPQLLKHHSCSLFKLVCLTGTWELGAAAAALQSQDTKGILSYLKKTDLETKNYLVWLIQNATIHTHHFPLPSLKTCSKLISQDIENQVGTDTKTSLLLVRLHSVKSCWAGCCRRKVNSGIAQCQFPHATVVACPVRWAHWHNSSTKVMKITDCFWIRFEACSKGERIHACCSKPDLKLRNS